jgi:aqualysin 1
MKKIWILVAVLTAGAIAVSLVPSKIEGHQTKLRKAENPIPNRYIVVLDQDAMRGENETAERSAGRLLARYGGEADRVYRHALKGFAAEMTPKAAEEMSRDPEVLFVEEDAYVSVNATQTNAPWGLDRVDQRSVPLNSAYNYIKTGSGVNVYVIDTGVLPTHVDFGGRATAVFDSMYDGRNGVDCHGHGTHVAATIGGNNYGIAKNVNIRGVRVLGCNGIGTVSSTVEGVDWVTANFVAPAVVNMSMGSNASPLMDYAVQSSINAGVTYVAAAGNANTDACQYSPARVGAAITVGASDQTDTRASFSNYGSCVDLFAPGVGITSAWAWSNYASNTANGTSMATPHVTGAVALYLEDNRTATPSQVTAALMGTATTGTVSGATGGSPNLMLFTAPNGPTAGGANVSGSVLTEDDRGIKNVRVLLVENASGETRQALTNAFGHFTFDDVPAGSFYTLVIQSKRFTFENNPYSFSLGEDFVANTFIGVPRD